MVAGHAGDGVVHHEVGRAMLGNFRAPRPTRDGVSAVTRGGGCSHGEGETTEGLQRLVCAGWPRGSAMPRLRLGGDLPGAAASRDVRKR